MIVPKGGQSYLSVAWPDVSFFPIVHQSYIFCFLVQNSSICLSVCAVLSFLSTMKVEDLDGNI